MNYMTFVEETDDKRPTKISFYVNTDNKVFFEMGPDDADMYEYQCIVLGKNDVTLMIEELQRLLNDYEVAD